MKKLMMLVVVVLLVCISGAQATVNIDYVTVGNAGNTGEQSRLIYGDTTYYGGVNYEYQIGKYEVTAGQYTGFLNAVAKTDTYGLYNTSMDSSSHGCQIQRSGSSGSYSYSVATDWANRPVNDVSWGDATRFANWLHNEQPTGGQTAATTEDGAYYLNGAMSIAELVVPTRKAGAQVWLPSEDEWYKAAYHKNDGVTGNYFDFPTSSDSEPGRDMTEATNPGNNANYYDGGYVTGSPYYRTEVGEFELSDSPYGTFDMGGNVWEWNEALIGSIRGVRGGSFSNSDGILRSSYRSDSSPGFGSNVVGFRVASVPEPCSLILLSLGGLMLRRKRMA